MKPFDPPLDRLAVAKKLLLDPYDLDEARLQGALASIFEHRADYADLDFQYTRNESFSLEEGIVKSGSFDIEQGVGVRAVSGEKTAFAYSDDLSEEALLEAAETTNNADGVVYLNAATNTVLAGITFNGFNCDTNVGADGIKLTGTSFGTTVTNCSVLNVARGQGILGSGTAEYALRKIVGCTISNSAWFFQPGDPPSHGVYFSVCQSNWIEHCIIVSNYSAGIQFHGGNASNNVIRWNRIYGNSAGIYADSGGNGTLIANNWIYNNVSAGIQVAYCDGIRTANNTIVSNAYGITLSHCSVTSRIKTN